MKTNPTASECFQSSVNDGEDLPTLDDHQSNQEDPMQVTMSLGSRSLDGDRCPARQITVLVALRQVIMSQGLCFLLKSYRHFKIVGEVRTSHDLIAAASTLRPDIILMETGIMGINSFDLLHQIFAVSPTTKAIALAAQNDDIWIERVATEGVAGFLDRQTSIEVLTNAICEVVKGNTFFSPSIVRRLRHSQGKGRDRNGLPRDVFKRLSPREFWVLQLVANGSTNKAIGVALGISIKTVEKHRQNLMNKINLHETAGLTRYAIATGVIEPPLQLRVI